MRLLVTGGAGFIGSHFIRYALQQPEVTELVNVDALTYAANTSSLADVKSDPRYSFAKADINETAFVQELVMTHKITAIVNFAAESHVDRSIENAHPFYHSNVAGVLSLLDVVRATQVERLLQVSTDEVYGAIPAGADPVDELAQIRPTSPYAASKAAADLFALADYKTFGTPVVISRSANNYGTHQHPEKLIPKTITQALQQAPIPVYGNGLQQRDWLSVLDNCRALFAILTKGNVGSVYNVSADNPQTNLAIIERILDLMGQPHDLINHVSDRPGHDVRYAMSHQKLTSALGFLPTVSFSNGLAQTIQWYETHQAWLNAFGR